MAIIHLDAENFNEAINSNETIVVDFYVVMWYYNLL